VKLLKFLSTTLRPTPGNVKNCCHWLPVSCCYRLPDHRTLYPADVVLFEGILVLYSNEVRELLQMKLFVDTDSDTRLARRGDTSFV